MAIDIDWGNCDETILILTFEKDWNANDLIDAIDQANQIIHEANQTVNLIFDMQRGTETPDNLIYLAQMGLKKTERNREKVGIITIISQTSLWQRIFNIAIKLTPANYDVRFVRDTHQAYDLIEATIQSKDQTQPTRQITPNFILYVEDNKLNQDLVKSMLIRQYDCHVLFAEDNIKALQLIEDFSPKVVIMDYHLPGSMDGAEIAKLIKANPETNHIPVVALTADIHSRQALMEAGCDAYINKPIRHQLFIKTLEPYLSDTVKTDRV